MTANDRLIRIAVDAMGGDYGPAEIVAGAVQAGKDSGIQIKLVGDKEKVQPELTKYDIGNLDITVVPAEGVIEENEPPALALRQKPRASILVSTGMVKEGGADASVTMGSTGAAMAAAAVLLGVIDGIDRPALGGPIIGLASQCMIIDLGTNVDCRPRQLLSFGVIGDVFVRQFWKLKNPRVGLLSVGAEAGKGNRLIREASEMFSRSGLNFIGNIEANDILNNRAEVVVCDGFVGNIVMKLTEGLGLAISKHLRKRLQDKLSTPELNEVVDEVYELNNRVESVGGGPLFGVNGISVVGHGRAKADAVRLAIGTARDLVENGFISKLNKGLTQMKLRIGE